MTKYANFEMGVHQNPGRGHFHHFTVPLRKVVEHNLDTPTDFVIFLLLFHPQILDAYATIKEKKK